MDRTLPRPWTFEREAILIGLRKLNIHLHCPDISSIDDISILDKYGIDRYRPNGHRWVYKGDPQPDGTGPKITV
ncbi:MULTISPECIES: hypothetical protein [Halolamina]|uniref:hypothetical protein n=1 Tax=Halolamina TaxID=1075397 RepID=UPI0011600CDC|nr:MULTISPECIES: hypothetical protein [Halolamina]NHX37463.1 hypothetical protein [Halolamina sp. R1-12]